MNYPDEKGGEILQSNSAFVSFQQRSTVIAEFATKLLETIRGIYDISYIEDQTVFQFHFSTSFKFLMVILFLIIIKNVLDYHKKLQTSRKTKLKNCLAFDI